MSFGGNGKVLHIPPDGVQFNSSRRLPVILLSVANAEVEGDLNMRSDLTSEGFKLATAEKSDQQVQRH